MNKILIEVCGLVVLLGGTSLAQVTQRVSVSSSGVQGNDDSTGGSLSPGGRYVAFESLATNLVSGEIGMRWDVFVRDRQTGSTERVSVDSDEMQASSDCSGSSISDDGRYVAFFTLSWNLVPGDTNNRWDIFVRDRQSGTTERVSLDSAGIEGNSDSFSPSISADGRYVAFASTATNLVPGDTNGQQDAFVHDRQSGTTERVSVDSSEAQGNNVSEWPRISADGRYVAFASSATNLVPGDTNAVWDLFVRDLQSGTTERVSIDADEMQGNGHSLGASISADGRYAAFWSYATNLVSVSVTGVGHVYVRDRQSGTTELVSVDSGRVPGNDLSLHPSISADGRCVAFKSRASTLVSGDTLGTWDLFLRDRLTGTTERLVTEVEGVLGGNDPASISSDGRYVAFWSVETDVVPGDTNGSRDVFLHDRAGSPSFTSLCEPGVGGVIACPCSNPSGGFGQGCDNSSGTFGALLTASGGSYLSSDSLVFVTLGERPTALSIVLQGNALIASGAVYGQGVRCAGGSLKRLFNKSASGGSITAPDFDAGDPSVSAQSAAKGDPISAGQSRWYLVYYRDPIVLGGCPASSTFNSTQTGQVSWSP